MQTPSARLFSIRAAALLVLFSFALVFLPAAPGWRQAGPGERAGRRREPGSPITV